jgi:hypothetical protein
LHYQHGSSNRHRQESAVKISLFKSLKYMDWIAALVYEGIVLHDQGPEAENGEWYGNEVSEGHRLPTRSEGEDVYGKFLMYGKDQQRKEVRKHRNVAICKEAEAPRWKAEQMLRKIILKETRGAGIKAAQVPDDSLTFRWFVQQRYIPMRQGSWSPAYKKLNGLAEKGYSEAVVRQCFINVRSVTRLAKK